MSKSAAGGSVVLVKSVRLLLGAGAAKPGY
jgi:hypothetical protein